MTRWWKKDDLFATYRWSSKRKTRIEINTKHEVDLVYYDFIDCSINMAHPFISKKGEEVVWLNITTRLPSKYARLIAHSENVHTKDAFTREDTFIHHIR